MKRAQVSRRLQYLSGRILIRKVPGISGGYAQRMAEIEVDEEGNVIVTFPDGSEQTFRTRSGRV